MVSTLTGLADIRAVAALLIMVILGILTVGHLSRMLRSRQARHLVILAPMVDLLAFTLLFVRNGNLVADAQLWHLLATIAAEVIGSGGTEEFPAALQQEGKDGYIWILGALYFIGGPAPTLGICLNMICRAVTATLVALATQDLVDASSKGDQLSQRSSIVAMCMAVSLPAFAFWSPQLLRESITIAAIAAATFFLARYVLRRHIGYLLLAVPPMIILTWVRETLGIRVSLALLVGTLYSALGFSRGPRQFRGLLVACAIPALPVLLNAVLGLLGVDQSRISGTTAALSNTASSGFPGLASGLPPAQVFLITFPRVLAGPFPWEFSLSPVMLLAFTELFCWWLVAAFAVRGILQFRKQAVGHRPVPAVALFCVVAAALIVGLSIVVGNYGILARFRPMITVVLIPLAATGVVSVRHRSKWSDRKRITPSHSTQRGDDTH